MFVSQETKVEFEDLEVTCQGSPALSSLKGPFTVVQEINPVCGPAAPPAVCREPFPELSCGTFWKNKWGRMGGEKGIEQPVL